MLRTRLLHYMVHHLKQTLRPERNCEPTTYRWGFHGRGSPGAVDAASLFCCKIIFQVTANVGLVV